MQALITNTLSQEKRGVKIGLDFLNLPAFAQTEVLLSEFLWTN